MQTSLLISQLIVSGLLILSILSQEKGAGLSATFGGTGQLYRGRRGADRLLFWITIVLGVIFVGISLASLLLAGSPLNSPVTDPSVPAVEGTPINVNVNAETGAAPPSN